MWLVISYNKRRRHTRVPPLEYNCPREESPDGPLPRDPTSTSTPAISRWTVEPRLFDDNFCQTDLCHHDISITVHFQFDRSWKFHQKIKCVQQTQFYCTSTELGSRQFMTTICSQIPPNLRAGDWSSLMTPAPAGRTRPARGMTPGFLAWSTLSTRLFNLLFWCVFFN